MKKKLMLILMMSLIGMTAFAQNSTNYVDLGLSVSWATCNLGRFSLLEIYFHLRAKIKCLFQ